MYYNIKEIIIMKLTKRILCLLLAMTLAFALCACGEKEEEKKDENTGNTGGFVNQTQTTVDDWAGNLDGDNQFNDAELDWG